jgi:hypothetical protein
MSYQDDDNYISIGGWMLILLVMSIPGINVIMLFVWAFFGNNQTRKNYFRAILMWMVVLIAAIFILAAIGKLPELPKRIPGFKQQA